MVPQALRDLTQWLVWRLEPKLDAAGKPDPGGKLIKAPYYANAGKRWGEQGTAEDRSKLTTFDHAMTMMSRRQFTGIGFTFLPGDGLIGIDLDDVVDKQTGEIAEHASRIVAACSSFTEYSYSGAGLHVYVAGDTKTAKSDDIGVEIYCRAQYFAFTGRHFPGTPETVNPISAEALALVHGMIAEAKEKKRQSKLAAAPPASSRAKPRPPRAPGDNDFAKVNAAALANLDAWVPALFPAARRSSGGYRVSSRDLGRNLEEDLSIHTTGIVDFGVADMGDAHDGGRTPIDLVIEWGRQPTPRDAMLWLASHLGIEIKTRGSRKPRTNAATGSGGGDGAPPGADDEPPPEGLPVIRWTGGDLPEIVDQAEDALKQSGEEIYQRDRMLVRVMRRAMPSVRNYKRPAGTLGIVPVELPYLVETFTRSARWEKWDARKKNPDNPDKLGDWRAINAPEQAASTYMARAGHWKLPQLWAVISAPTLRPDGTILQTPGYDAALKTWYDPCGVEFPVIPEHPTHEDAEIAMGKITRAFATLPFESEVDASVAYSLALCSLVRRSLTSAPLGAITAPVMAAGKTLLADCISILATGSSAPAMTYAETDEEARKTALAVLMEGDAVVLIDNVERPLQGDWLCSILTQETFSQRMLGRTEMVKVLTTTLILATGNQMIIAGDLRTRALLCRIDPKHEHPEEREFKVDLRDWFLAHRTELVVAGLTVMRAYIASGAHDIVKPWGRFEKWSEMVRAPLVWLGLPDPCTSLKAIERDDPERGTHLQLMSAWHTCFGDKAKTSHEACEVARKAAVMDSSLAGDEKALEAILREIAVDRGGAFNARRLSAWLRKHAERRAGGLLIVKDIDDNNHVGTWKVTKVN
jgi:hypothetical protein